MDRFVLKSELTPERIPFSYPGTPIMPVDMTLDSRNKFDKNLRVEIWIEVDTSDPLLKKNVLINSSTYTIEKIESQNKVQQINFPDIDPQFWESQNGYILLAN